MTSPCPSVLPCTLQSEHTLRGVLRDAVLRQAVTLVEQHPSILIRRMKTKEGCIVAIRDFH